jgi:dihydrolipoamide dehydrogenase
MPVKMAVIGAGSGGYVAAVRAAQLGAEVTLVEEDHVGGTCLNWGCIPSKILIHAAELVERLRNAPQWGISLDDEVRIDLQALSARKQRVIETQREGLLKIFKHYRIRYLKGRGILKGPHMAAVTQEGGRTLDVPWDRLILATGSQPLALSSLPFDHKRVLDSNDVLSLTELPPSLLIVGGGVIGCEFAFLFSALGSRVTVVEALSRILPLPNVDPDISKVIQREMKKRKVLFMVDRIVEKMEPLKDRIRVILRPARTAYGPESKNRGKDTEEILTLEGDRVLVGVGRRPNTASLGLENLGISLEPEGWIRVNNVMETADPHVYAIGDLLGPSRPMLAHVAAREGLIAAENAMGGGRVMSYDAVPGVIFTLPEVAHVGMTEAKALEAGYNVGSDTVLFRNLGKAQVMGLIEGQVKLIWDKKSGRILGVHMVGSRASDLIAEGVLAVRKGITIKELAETVHAHPTLAEVMVEVAHKALGMPIHG